MPEREIGCGPHCPPTIAYRVWAQRADAYGRIEIADHVHIEPYPEGESQWELWVRPLPWWRRWLRRFTNRESLFTTEPVSAARYAGGNPSSTKDPDAAPAPDVAGEVPAPGVRPTPPPTGGNADDA